MGVDLTLLLGGCEDGRRKSEESGIGAAVGVLGGVVVGLALGRGR